MKKRFFNNVKSHKENANVKLDKVNFFVLLSCFIGMFVVGLIFPPTVFNALTSVGIIGMFTLELIDGKILFSSDFSHKSIFSKALSYANWQLLM